MQQIAADRRAVDSYLDGSTGLTRNRRRAILGMAPVSRYTAFEAFNQKLGDCFVVADRTPPERNVAYCTTATYAQAIAAALNAAEKSAVDAPAPDSTPRQRYLPTLAFALGIVLGVLIGRAW